MQNSFHHKLMRTHFAMHRKIMSRAKALGLTSGQPKVLEFLSESDGVEQKTIAENCDIERATVGSILDRMEQSGFIERRRRDGNRRSIYVYLTDKGRAAAAEMERIFSESEEQAFCGVEGGAENVNAVLDKVYDNLCEQGEKI